MARFNCPHCKEPTLSWLDKYQLGLWMTKTCRNCGARISAVPLVLMAMHFIYAWNVLWWGALVHFNDSYHYVIYMAVCWVILDALNVAYMPLASLRQKR